MDDGNKELDYNLLLLNHLSRISYVSTALNSDMETITETTRSVIGAKTHGLAMGVSVLEAFIPSRLYDKAFSDFMTALHDEQESKTFLSFQYNKLRALIDLMDRKGLLMQNRKVGVAGVTAPLPTEEWED